MYQFNLNGYGPILNSLSRGRVIPGLHGQTGLLPAQKQAAAAATGWLVSGGCDDVPAPGDDGSLFCGSVLPGTYQDDACVYVGKGVSLDPAATPLTVFCEWTADNVHRNMGPGPEPEAGLFLAAAASHLHFGLIGGEGGPGRQSSDG